MYNSVNSYFIFIFISSYKEEKPLSGFIIHRIYWVSPYVSQSQFDKVFWQIAPVMSIDSGKMSQWVKSVENCTASLCKTAPTAQIPPSIPAD